MQFGDTTHKVSYTYDKLGRVSSRTAMNGSNTLTSSYTFAAGGFDTGTISSTTPLVTKITQNGISFEYAYDELGNIVSEKRGGLTTTYVYDALGQLIRVNDPNDTTGGTTGTTCVYEYDWGGNILSKKKYAYTAPEDDPVGALVTNDYEYGDANWKDKLTAFNGQTITYDAIGNPLNDGTWTYTWTAGRQLAQMSKTGMTVQFKYNHDGLRTQKIVTENGVTTTTEYTYHGTMLTHMKKGSDELHFFYDAQTRPTMVEYNEEKYHYLHNLQGDIVGIIDSNGNKVVEYKYDAWGKLLVATGTRADTLGCVNPLRYRGYVFDAETDLYYLQNRFYCCRKCRFINADKQISNMNLQRANIHNTFAYCLNNPIVSKDDTGEQTYMVGLELSGSFIFRIGAGVMCVWDDKGNVGIAYFVELGGGTPSLSFGLSTGLTNADTIWDMEGYGFNVGGSFVIGADVVIGNARDGSPVIGAQVSKSFGPDFVPDVELHGSFTITNVIPYEEASLFLKILVKIALGLYDGEIMFDPIVV